MKTKKFILKAVVLAVIFAFLITPSINPLLSADAKSATAEQLRSAVGAIKGSAKGIFDPARLITLLAVIIGIWLFSLLFNFIMETISKKKTQASSVLTLISSLVRYLCVIVAIVWGLGILGVNTTGIFASVGVLSLIVGIGAQSLIEDTITGMFIIFEKNYSVGDFIVLDDFRGRVRRIGIRTTCIEDEGGNLKIVNNSDIRNFQNRSEKLSLAVCDVGTSYDADIREIEKVLIPALDGFYDRNKDVFENVPIYKGIQELGDSAVVLRLVVNTTEEHFYEARRRLNREIKILFDEKKIEIPFTQIVLHQQ